MGRNIDRGVIQLTLKGNKLKEYKNLVEASADLKIPVLRIRVCCNKRRNTTHGFIFRYLDEYKKEEVLKHIENMHQKREQMKEKLRNHYDLSQYTTCV